MLYSCTDMATVGVRGLMYITIVKKLHYLQENNLFPSEDESYITMTSVNDKKLKYQKCATLLDHHVYRSLRYYCIRLEYC